MSFPAGKGEAARILSVECVLFKLEAVRGVFEAPGSQLTLGKVSLKLGIVALSSDFASNSETSDLGKVSFKFGTGASFPACNDKVGRTLSLDIVLFKLGAEMVVGVGFESLIFKGSSFSTAGGISGLRAFNLIFKLGCFSSFSAELLMALPLGSVFLSGVDPSFILSLSPGGSEVGVG